eukprot:CAMPEP_0168401510 /NCGR_PEP_ID=MMETSP0228-20121227/23148_1 /TAXON_ID=133427 /ORGANISM="Protoceratium reticulatum, Strain CCCM 535 (=CCMP 1889)" /LENGTH=113 /DNA_ID=CAMNT_0008415079 /DNA_START=197 /DNA_END=538 /DNA_ORIENTATION=+
MSGSVGGVTNVVRRGDKGVPRAAKCGSGGDSSCSKKCGSCHHDEHCLQRSSTAASLLRRSQPRTQILLGLVQPLRSRRAWFPKLETNDFDGAELFLAPIRNATERTPAPECPK